MHDNYSSEKSDNAKSSTTTENSQSFNISSLSKKSEIESRYSAFLPELQNNLSTDALEINIPFYNPESSQTEGKSKKSTSTESNDISISIRQKNDGKPWKDKTQRHQRHCCNII
jgi:hypothetical protein